MRQLLRVEMHCATFESPPPRAGASECSESVYATRPSPLDRAAQVSWVTTTHTQEILTISPNARTTTKYAIMTPMSAHSKLVVPTLSSMSSAGVRSLSRDVPSPDRVQDSWETVLTWTALTCGRVTVCSRPSPRYRIHTIRSPPAANGRVFAVVGLRSLMILSILATHLRFSPYLMTLNVVSQYELHLIESIRVIYLFV